jgi:hypothetical protein
MIAFRKGLGATSPYTSQITAAIPAYCPSCPTSLVLALVQQESGGQQFTSSGAPVTGSSGDTGLFQLLPATAAGLNVDPTTVDGNIQGGLTLLQQDYNQFGNWTQALEAYNEGPTGLTNQIAAGQTPASAGYASSILAAAGISTSPAAPAPDDSDTDDSTDSSSLLPSVDLSFLTDLPDETGLSWPLLALIGAGILAAAYALS